ncbi:MAG: S1/P1 nuclease [Gammaproteobacteria bacterium]
MRSSLLVIVIFLVSILFPYQVNAWNAVGHMVIAHIAYERLTPQVRAKVDNIVATFSKEYPDMTQFDQIAIWADNLRGQRIETFSHWHYIDVAFTDDGTPLKNMVDTDNIVWAINHIEPIVKNEKANPFEKARFLAFLVHCVGDAHQPLHTVTRISKKHPSGDRGGNLFLIQHTAGLKAQNLHSLWDEGLGVFEGGQSPSNIASIAHMITSTYPEKFFGTQVNDEETSHWATEGLEVATKFVYKITENVAPDNAYLEAGKQIAEQRAALAGYRLAIVLNQLLG